MMVHATGETNRDSKSLRVREMIRLMLPPPSGHEITGVQEELEHLERKKVWNSRDLYHYQRFLIVLFYSRFALRGDLADVKIRKPFGSNWLKKAGSKYELHVGEHKTSKAHGAIELTLGPELQKARAMDCAGQCSMR